MSSIFSGKSARKAALYATQLAQENQANIDARITTGKSEALSALDAGLAPALDALSGGYSKARGEYADARASFDPYVQAGTTALGQYGDGIGLNGDAGYDRATASFRASPGHQFMVDEATDAVLRKQSAIGALSSGNTMQQVADRAEGVADQEWGSYLDRLKGVSDLGYNASSQQAGLTKGIGDLYAGEGGADANLYSTNAAQKAGVIGNATQEGVTTQQNTGNSIVQNGKDYMMAGYNASANQWSALLGGAKLAAGIAGSALGGGGALSKLLGI